MSGRKEGLRLAVVLGALLVTPPLWYGTVVALLQFVGFFVYGEGDGPAWADWLFDVLPLSVGVLSAFAGGWAACWAYGRELARQI